MQTLEISYLTHWKSDWHFLRRVNFELLHLVKAQVNLDYSYEISEFVKFDLVIRQIDRAHVGEMDHIFFEYIVQVMFLNVHRGDLSRQLKFIPLHNHKSIKDKRSWKRFVAIFLKELHYQAAQI